MRDPEQKAPRNMRCGQCKHWIQKGEDVLRGRRGVRCCSMSCYVMWNAATEAQEALGRQMAREVP